jgi:hypothetical protein
MDTIVYMVRNRISPRGPKQLYAMEVAKKRLRSTFARDVHTGRRLLWHAAQVVAVANEYLVSAPCEIMRVFMAYIFILSYSAYGPRATTGSGKKPIRLDLAECDRESEAHIQAVSEWIREGGPARLGSVEDICSEGGCVQDISRDAQVMMQRLRCWGLAEKFTRILHVFEVDGF